MNALEYFATREKELRLARNLTLIEVSEQISAKYETSVSKSAISRYENSEREPSARFLRYFAEFYGVSTDYLLGLVDDPKAKYGGGSI